MRIGLDYDKTYTLNPRFWNDFIQRCRADEVDVRIVTIRDERHDRTPDIQKLEGRLPVIYTRGVAKKFFVMHFVPDFWPVSVWVDDKPETITHNSETTPEDLAAWRAERGEPTVEPVSADLATRLQVAAIIAEREPCPICGKTTPHHPEHSLP